MQGLCTVVPPTHPPPHLPPSLQMRERTVAELLSVTDSLELREGDMQRTRAELRSTRAEVAAMEGRFEAEMRWGEGGGGRGRGSGD